ncbi:unnamed protein product [Bursaphelenchus xylophilus]|uniref:(pine wood nematode) hypothetical protein n=1 Tax=Bursaphelenchus xylophilus TaxID=6326 RepID=A0A1I7RJZ5_BURXY|nr:unnamed protein product [Bursaphelenchus xylophilus]CAG9131617.1 unnamed protein product [Bursaphelenchus xylophilus]
MASDSSRKSLQSTCSIDIDEIDEDLLNEKCCFGYMNLFTCLAMLAVVNLVVDIVGAILAMGTDIMFLFVVIAIGSMLCLAAIITSIREEKKRMVNLTKVWVVFKFLIMGLSALILILENSMELELTGITMSPINELWPLILLLPLFVLFLGAQYYISSRVVKLIAIRDEIYIIPSSPGSVRLRESLRVELERRKSKVSDGVAKF